MTSEEKVRRVYPRAYLYKHTLWVTVYRVFKSKRSEIELSCWAATAPGAWADAWRRIQALQKAGGDSNGTK